MAKAILSLRTVLLSKVQYRCRPEEKMDQSFGWGPPMTVQNKNERSDYDASHLVLYGVAAIVLLVFFLTFAH